MKQLLKKLLLCAAAGLLATGSASAVTLSEGVLTFTGRVTLTPPSLENATSILTFSTPGEANMLEVTDSFGSFGTLSPDDTFTATGPLALGGGKVNLFTLGAYSFTLDSSTFTQDASFINVTGFGILTGPGFDPTPAKLLLTTQEGAVENRYSLSGSLIVAHVPEGGSAVLLLGLGLAGVEMLRRRMTAARV